MGLKLYILNGLSADFFVGPRVLVPSSSSNFSVHYNYSFSRHQLAQIMNGFFFYIFTRHAREKTHQNSPDSRAQNEY
jgi:hypothetical protein